MKKAFNPYLPLNEYIPDGEPHVFGDRVYIYGSHDKENGEDFCMLDYVTYSASVYDLKDWRYEGVIYKAERDPLYPQYKYMYAPDVVKGNDGRYYLYYSLANTYPDCSYIMSVAVCDTPFGDFQYLGYIRYKDGTPMQDYAIFDPACLNDNGAIRFYYGMWFDFDENPQISREQSIEKQMSTFKKTRDEVLNTPGGVMGPIYVELEDDMMTVKDTPRRIFPAIYNGTDFKGHEFFEASSMRKVGDKYYFIYSSWQNHELCYAVSDYPDKNFKFGGVIISNGDVGYEGRRPEDRLMRSGNNHGSIEFINGKWYIFYHRHTTKMEFSRQGCAEEIRILEDGSIPQVEMTSCGLNGGPLAAEGVYPAAICCNLTNGKMPHCWCPNHRLPYLKAQDDERFISEIEEGTKIGYKYFSFDGDLKIGVKYRSYDITPKGKLLIRLSLDGEAIAEIPVADSCDWISAEADAHIEGIYPLYFEYTGEGSIELLEFYFKRADRI